MWINAEFTQQHQTICRGGPRLTFGPIARIGLTIPRGEERASRPETILALQGQQPGAPAFGGHPRMLGLTTSAGASTRSLSVCQRIEGSESSSQSSAVTSGV
jgi:hypothetical protein